MPFTESRRYHLLLHPSDVHDEQCRFPSPLSTLASIHPLAMERQLDRLPRPLPRLHSLPRGRGSLQHAHHTRLLAARSPPRSLHRHRRFHRSAFRWSFM